jgi:DNA-binding response OmpR family regulator
MFFRAVYLTTILGSRATFVGTYPRRWLDLNERLFDVNGTMRFPTTTVEAIPRMESNHRADQNPPAILVVDDERAIADTLSVILGKNGFAVMTAYNGTSALEIATLVPPQLLISDVMMPGMSGIDLAIAIRDAVPNCEVILFSARAFTADLLASARLAGLDFMALTKPVHPSEMLARVSERLALRKEVPIKKTGIQTIPSRDRAEIQKSTLATRTAQRR